jgi:leucyl-tRNA synthetase
MILGEVEITGYQTADGQWVSAAEVTENAAGEPVTKAGGHPLKAVRVPAQQAEKKGESFVLSADPAIRLESRAYKMSKSRGNVVNPDAVVAEYGADSLRLYEMFMGPLEAVKPWQTAQIQGMVRFRDRLFSTCARPLVDEIDDATRRLLHKTIKKVTNDIESMSFNTAITAMQVLVNHLSGSRTVPREAARALALLVSPFAPHLGEEIWSRLGNERTLAYEPWPTWDEALCIDDVVEVPVQVNGRVRGRVTLSRMASEDEARAAALADQGVRAFVGDKALQKTVYVPGKILNLVV